MPRFRKALEKMERGRRAEALQLLGLARRAGGVVSGTDAARRSVRKGEARLVLMAGDASDVQLDKVRNILKNRPIPWGTLGDRATLGAAVGRGPVSVVAVTVASLADRLRAELGTDTAGEANQAEDWRQNAGH
jgi:ribosomal protein L7Ae-like RNA K-turn-binding protein